MHLHESTEGEMEKNRGRFEDAGYIECEVPFHKNGVSTLNVALESAKTTLFGEAKQRGAHAIVFEPHLELHSNREECTLILSARAYTYATEQ